MHLPPSFRGPRSAHLISIPLLACAATDGGIAHLDAYAVHLDALGERYERLDAADMKQLTGTDYKEEKKRGRRD